MNTKISKSEKRKTTRREKNERRFIGNLGGSTRGGKRSGERRLGDRRKK